MSKRGLNYRNAITAAGRITAGDLSDGNSSDIQNKFMYRICMIVFNFPLLALIYSCGACRDGEVTFEKEQLHYIR